MSPLSDTLLVVPVTQPRLIVESWDPAYGTPIAPEEDLEPSAATIDTSVEMTAWTPIEGVDDGVTRVMFVDGVRRVDARLTLSDEDGVPVPGLAGSFAVGAVGWDREARRSEVTDVRISRLAAFTDGHRVDVPTAGAVKYEVESEPSPDPARLISRLHGAMRRAEGELTSELANRGLFVVADGPVNDTRAREVVGYVKTHRVRYLTGAEASVIGKVVPGERTPLFILGAGGTFARFSWYQRLPYADGRHAWSGVVRCEVPGSLGIETAIVLANRAAAILPAVAAPAHTDPRAPQNLVPIGALERWLRHELGDPRLVYRELVRAVEENR